MTSSEAELWALSCAHDGRAFAGLFDLHRDRVFRHCVRLVDNAHDAEEVTAAAFFELWWHRGRVVPVDGSVLPWLLVTASKLSRNVSRGTRRYRALFDSLPRETPVVEPVTDAEDRALTAIRSLRSVDASLVTLVHVDGYPVTEAAAALGLSAGAARTRLHRARRRLRDLLDLDDRDSALDDSSLGKEPT